MSVSKVLSLIGLWTMLFVDIEIYRLALRATGIEEFLPLPAMWWEPRCQVVQDAVSTAWSILSRGNPREGVKFSGQVRLVCVAQRYGSFGEARTGTARNSLQGRVEALYAVVVLRGQPNRASEQGNEVLWAVSRMSLNV
jgi:hypothetical protein